MGLGGGLCKWGPYWCLQIWPILPLGPMLILHPAISFKDTQYSLNLQNKFCCFLMRNTKFLPFLSLLMDFFNFFLISGEQKNMRQQHPLPLVPSTLQPSILLCSQQGQSAGGHVMVLHITPSLLTSSRDPASTSEQQVTPWYFKSFKRKPMGKWLKAAI